MYEAPEQTSNSAYDNRTLRGGQLKRDTGEGPGSSLMRTGEETHFAQKLIGNAVVSRVAAVGLS
jgi:hypothetical protein